MKKWLIFLFAAIVLFLVGASTMFFLNGGASYVENVAGVIIDPDASDNIDVSDSSSDNNIVIENTVTFSDNETLSFPLENPLFPQGSSGGGGSGSLDEIEFNENSTFIEIHNNEMYFIGIRIQRYEKENAGAMVLHKLFPVQDSSFVVYQAPQGFPATEPCTSYIHRDDQVKSDFVDSQCIESANEIIGFFGL
jgi:hypothetical protein